VVNVLAGSRTSEGPEECLHVVEITDPLDSVPARAVAGRDLTDHVAGTDREVVRPVHFDGVRTALALCAVTLPGPLVNRLSKAVLHRGSRIH
jgi:hypothetical protein